MSNNPSNPFLNHDLSKFMDMSKLMDPSKMMDMSKFPDMSKFTDLTKMMSECKIPNVDVESLMASQKKNIEVMTSTNQKNFEVLQSYMNKQTELAKQSFEAATKLMQDVVAAPTPEEKVAKQVEATKNHIETCVSSLKELSELLSENQAQTMKVVSTAMCESMEGLQDMMKATKASS